MNPETNPEMFQKLSKGEEIIRGAMHRDLGEWKLSRNIGRVQGHNSIQYYNPIPLEQQQTSKIESKSKSMYLHNVTIIGEDKIKAGEYQDPESHLVVDTRVLANDTNLAVMQASLQNKEAIEEAMKTQKLRVQVRLAQ